MTPVGDRIKDLCKRRGVTLAAACDGAGIAYKTLHAQITRDRDIPLASVDRLARYFGVPLDYFSSYRAAVSIRSDDARSRLHRLAAGAYTEALRDAQLQMMREGYDFGTDEVLDWLARNNGVLQDFDALSERVDLFHPIQSGDTIMRPHRLGRQSLASIFFDLEDEDHYLRTVSKFSRSVIDATMTAHIEASRFDYKVNDQTIDVMVGDRQVSGRYRRVIAPVRDRRGTQFTLVHAKVI